MKLVAQICIGVLIAGMLLWWMTDPDGFRHRMFGYSQQEIDQKWQKVQDEVDRNK